jgi:hypothetical protein
MLHSILHYTQSYSTLQYCAAGLLCLTVHLLMRSLSLSASSWLKVSPVHPYSDLTLLTYLASLSPRRQRERIIRSRHYSAPITLLFLPSIPTSPRIHMSCTTPPFPSHSDTSQSLFRTLYLSLSTQLPHTHIPTPTHTSSYKPQKISPKFQGTVRELLHKKIREFYIHPQFVSDVMRPMRYTTLLVPSLSSLLKLVLHTLHLHLAHCVVQFCIMFREKA